MTTYYSPEETKRLMDQILAAQNQVAGLSQQINGGLANPNPTQTLNAAQMGGASGVGFENQNTQDVISGQVASTTSSGGSKSQAGEYVTDAQAGNLIAGYGLKGLIDPKAFAGLTYGQAAQKAREEQKKRTGQISANTSFAFNPETISKTQRAIDKFGFALNDITNDPFEPKDFKEEKTKNTIEVTSKEIGSIFDSADQLYNAYNTDQQFKNTIDGFIQKGGSLEGIAKNITAPVTGQENIQSPVDYLSSITNNPAADKRAQEMALNELAPETAIAQDEISRLVGIPQDLQTLYFGDEKTMGVLQMRQEQAKEEVRIIEEQEKDAKRTVRERAELTLDKNKAELKQTQAKIEENRLAAKNYMTAQLAKLGALNTTGAAPLALQTLETKYQAQVTNLENSYKFAEREIQIGLNENLDTIENETNNKILKIEEDLTLDNEKSFKEVLKARQDAEKEIYRISEQYARRLRERTTKYTDDLKKEAEAYAKKFAKTASNGLDGGPLGLDQYQEGQYVDGKGVLLPNGKFAKLDLTPTLTREVESANVFGQDTIRYFVSLPTAFRQKWIQDTQSGARATKDPSGTFTLNPHNRANSVSEVKKEFDKWQKEQNKKSDNQDEESTAIFPEE